MTEKIATLKAIRDYFASDGGRTVTMDELKALTAQERAELARLCAVELGKELFE